MEQETTSVVDSSILNSYGLWQDIAHSLSRASPSLGYGVPQLICRNKRWLRRQSFDPFPLVLLQGLLEFRPGGQVANLALVRLGGPWYRPLRHRQATQNSHGRSDLVMGFHTRPALATFLKDALVPKTQFSMLGSSLATFGTNLAKAE